jgi:KDO2-lipid IV(A) lauroyltransferase
MPSSDTKPLNAPDGPGARTTEESGDQSVPARSLVLLAQLPLPLLYLLTRTLSALMLLLMPARRQIIRENIALAFPDRAASWHRRQLVQFRRNVADVIAEILKGYTLGRPKLDERVRIINPELLQSFATAGQSVMLVGSHQANWEWVFLACCGRIPFEICAVHALLGHPGIDGFLRVMRSRFGATMLTRKAFGRELIAGRNRLRAIVLTVDGKPLPEDECHSVRFLNQQTAFRSRFATLATLWNYPVIFADRRRTARGYYEVRFELLGEPPYDTLAPWLVERYAEALERSLRASPADWLWTQRRWNFSKPFYS